MYSATIVPDRMCTATVYGNNAAFQVLCVILSQPSATGYLLFADRISDSNCRLKKRRRKAQARQRRFYFTPPLSE